jgi:hypothetical protein
MLNDEEDIRREKKGAALVMFKDFAGTGDPRSPSCPLEAAVVIPNKLSSTVHIVMKPVLKECSAARGTAQYPLAASTLKTFH